MSLSERLWEGRAAFAAQHAQAWPTKVYLSPIATKRLLGLTCGVNGVKVELIEHGETAGQVWTIKRFAQDVSGMDWFEDSRMTDTTFRFA